MKKKHNLILLRSVAAILALALAWSSLSLSSAFGDNDASPLVDVSSSDNHRVLLAADVARSFKDPKTVEPRIPRPLNPGFDFSDPVAATAGASVEARLADMKFAEPTIVNTRSAGDRDVSRDLVIDVVSIGSQTRVDYLTAQVETWASHPNIRHFWGFTEEQDFQPRCQSVSQKALDAAILECRKPKPGWDPQVDGFVTEFFGVASGTKRTRASAGNAGWFCAQRRPGRALGWLQGQYGKTGGASTPVPDLLVLVDDDTSANIEIVKHYMDRDTGRPFVAGPCTFLRGGFSFPFGGFGTFLNRAAVERMTRPIFCNGQERDDAICATLQKSRIGELEAFREGDSVFELFHRYASGRRLCMHSDWLIGYMITFYSGTRLSKPWSQNCKGDLCTRMSVTCHKQSPKDMRAFFEERRPPSDPSLTSTVSRPPPFLGGGNPPLLGRGNPPLLGRGN